MFFEKKWRFFCFNGIYLVYNYVPKILYIDKLKGRKMSWNDENVKKLKELWDQGLPTAQIGKLLGFTKNAVVGKAHRIGLERRPSPIRRTAVKPDRKKARSPIMPTLHFENKLIEKKIRIGGM